MHCHWQSHARPESKIPTYWPNLLLCALSATHAPDKATRQDSGGARSVLDLARSRRVAALSAYDDGTSVLIRSCSRRPLVCGVRPLAPLDTTTGIEVQRRNQRVCSDARQLSLCMLATSNRRRVVLCGGGAGWWDVVGGVAGRVWGGEVVVGVGRDGWRVAVDMIVVDIGAATQQTDCVERGAFLSSVAKAGGARLRMGSTHGVQAAQHDSLVQTGYLRRRRARRQLSSTRAREGRRVQVRVGSARGL